MAALVLSQMIFMPEFQPKTALCEISLGAVFHQLR